MEALHRHQPPNQGPPKVTTTDTENNAMPTRTTLNRLLPATLAGALASVLSLAALKAAGLNGTAPANADAIKTLITTLTDNWIWLIGTGAGLVLVIVAGLLMVGSRSAPDWLFKIVGGVVLILVVIPAVLQ
jgi:type IV secretory pathway VirB2 component (pilin)